MQTTVLLSSARIPRRILKTWGNLLWLKTCKLQYYWARPEYWDGIWRLEETCCYWSHTSYSFIELGQNTEKDFGDLRKPVVSEVKQITVLLSSARILRRILATWGNLWLLDQCKLLYYWARPEYWEWSWRLEEIVVSESSKLQYYWARPEYREGIWRFEETCCYWRHANYFINELGQNTETGFGDLRKLVVTEAMQTTVLLSSARILKRDLEIWGNLLLLKPCKLQYYWARPKYWEIILETWWNLLLLKPCKLKNYWASQNTDKGFGDLRKLVTEAMQTTVFLRSARKLRSVLETWANLLFWLEGTCCYLGHTKYSIIELGQNSKKSLWELRTLLLVNQANYCIIELGPNTEKGFGDMR